MDKIELLHFDEVHYRVKTSMSIEQELADHFSFYAENYKYHPKVRARVWDGKIKLFSPRNRLIYKGLLSSISEFSEARGYILTAETKHTPKTISISDATQFIESLQLPSFLELRDYQITTFISAINNERRAFLSPTNSGKSFVMYLIFRYLNVRTLMIVPRTNLVLQMTGDFASYGYQDEVHQIYAGKEKTTNAQITVTTWQSIVDEPESFFSQFDLILGDEMHKFKANSLTEIMKKTKKTRYKFGFTGSLDELAVNQLIITGLFGKIETIITNKEMIDSGYSSNIKIKNVTLSYPESFCKQFRAEINTIKDKKKKYAYEIRKIICSESRSKFVVNLAKSLKGNTLVLFSFIDLHGKIMWDLANVDSTVPLFFLSGDTKTLEREEIRQKIISSEDSITFASMECFSEGVNIPNINSIIFAQPSQKRVKLLQSIGRGLRKTKVKFEFVLYDISDDLRYGKYVNYTFQHFLKRKELYEKEQFDYTDHRVKLKGMEI